MKEPGHCSGCGLGDAMERRDFLRSVSQALALLPFVPSMIHVIPSAARDPHLGSRALAEKAYPFPSGDGVSIDKDESVIIARSGNSVWAFSLACPHQNTAIRWEKGNNRFQCPKHKSRYRPDGTFIEGRATRGLDRFAIRRDAETLLVNLDALYREDKEAAQWTAAVIQVEK